MDVRTEANALVRELIERLAGSDARELEVRRDGLRVRVSRGQPRSPAPAVAEVTKPASATRTELAPPPAPPVGSTVNAPLTGIFYRSPSPQTPPLVQLGSAVTQGDVIGLIEAMKLFNEIRATRSGTVRRILAENGQLVRAHQPLLELD